MAEYMQDWVRLGNTMWSKVLEISDYNSQSLGTAALLYRF